MRAVAAAEKIGPGPPHCAGTGDGVAVGATLERLVLPSPVRSRVSESLRRSAKGTAVQLVDCRLAWLFAGLVNLGGRGAVLK